MRLIFTELKRAVRSKRFLIAVIGYALLLCMGVTEYWNDSAVYNFSIAYKTAFYMACFLCAALPFADSFLQDCRSGFWRSVVLRSGISQFCIAKPIVVFLSGFLAVTFASCLFICYLLIVFPIDNEFHIDYSGYDALLNEGRYVLYFGVKILLTAWSSAMMAVICLALSNIMKNTYALLVAPPLLYYVQNEIANAYLSPEWQLTRMLYTPLETFGSMANNILVSLSLWSCIAAFAGFLFYLQARRILRNA